MLELLLDLGQTEREKLGESFLWLNSGQTCYQLSERPDSIRLRICCSVVKHQLQD